MTKSTLDRLQAHNPEFTARIARGVETLQAGNLQAARTAFATAVRADPENATAWFWLSRTVDDEDQRAYCLSRVRSLDRTSAAEHSQPALEPRAPRRPLARYFWPVAALLVVLSLVCAATPLPIQPAARAAGPASEPTLVASGVIRAHEVTLASEYGGLVQEIVSGKGQSVSVGEVLVRLDTSLLDAQIETASAAVSLAEANLSRARAGARDGEVAIAEAQLAQARRARLAAAQTITDTTMLVQNPQEIQLKINVTKAEIAAAEDNLAQALALKDAAEVGKDAFQEAQEAIHEAGGPGRRRIRVKVKSGSATDLPSILPPEIRDQLPPAIPDGVYTFGDTEIEIHNGTFVLYRWVSVNLYLPLEAHLAPNAWWQAWIGVNAAAAKKEGLEASLNLLYNQRADPQEQAAQLDQARATMAQIEAQIVAAEAQVSGLKAGPSSEQIAALEANVRQAQASRDALLTQRDQMPVRSPLDGIVVEVSAHAGEVAAKGATLLNVANLDTVQLTVYLPEDELGRVALGQQVQVSVDSFPGQSFTATVVHVADQAEFTPRNIATQEERVNLVFAIELDLDNDEGRLKPGMPADAHFAGGAR